MKKVIFLLLTGSVLVACGGSGASNSSPGATASETTALTSSSVDGEAVYRTYCVNCHGLRGDMGGAGAYNLRKSELSLEERMEVIRNGRGMMAALGSLMSDEEIRAVAEFTFTLKD